MNPTELLLSHARDDIDRRLIEFGYDPWHLDAFSRLSPSERARRMSSLARWAHKVKVQNAAGLK